MAIQDREADNTVLREYTWGLNLGGGISGLIDLEQNGQNYAYLYDGKGNVVAILDNSEAVVATYQYDPFGILLAQTGSLTQPFGFSTKRYDPQTGLVYYGHRYYSPAIGRWTTRDPLGEAGGLNLYEFVGNNPVNWVDPWGLRAYVCVKKHKELIEVVIAIPIEYRIEIPSEYGSTWWIQSAIASWNAAIENKWTGLFGEYHVTTNVVMGPVAGHSPNIVHVLPDHSLLPPNADAKVKNWNEGLWPIQCDGNCVAHEAGHLMESKDHYHTYPGVAGCFSNPSWENNLMGCSWDPQFGKVESKNIKEILSNRDLIRQLCGGCGWVGN